MADIVHLKLVPPQPPGALEPRPELIERLERMLSMARSGEMVGMAMSTEMHDGNVD